jgi:hypothetical protein
MLTLQQLGETLQERHKHKQDFMFNADQYSVSVKFKEQIYIQVVLESLSNYPRQERNVRLLHYVQQNTNVLGYMLSTLAYTKNSDVVIQQYLDRYSSIDYILHSIDYLLQHADILTNSKY